MTPETPPTAPPPAPPPPPPELATALACFEAGDFRGVHAEVHRLTALGGPPEVVAAARALGGRLDPDPPALAVGLAATLALAAAVAQYVF